MTTTADLLDTLHQSLATQYPTFRAHRRVGAVSCVVVPESAVWDDGPDCDPWPLTLTVEVNVMGMADEKGAEDLPHHIAPVAALIRQGGFRPMSWRSATDNDNAPLIIITAVANGTDG